MMGKGRVSNAVRFARFNLLGTSPPCEEVSQVGAGWGFAVNLSILHKATKLQKKFASWKSFP